MKAMQKSINRVAAHNYERPSTRSTKALPQKKNAEMELLCIYMLDDNRLMKPVIGIFMFTRTKFRENTLVLDYPLKERGEKYSLLVEH
jgi:hypothetical protein